ncbi:MAG: TolC family protein [Chitinophagales bacterium]|nr:TolC family protein [Chitinophagales bacterium]
MNKIIFLLLILCTQALVAQDSVHTLSARQVMEIVKRYHPVALQAGILVEQAKADLVSARGQFDPVFENEAAQKTFEGTAYYSYNRPEISIPTWFGIEVKAGLEYLSGNRTDPVDTKGESSYLGISIPLAKNLLMDKRRAALQSAKIFRQASVAERGNMLNQLMLDALKSYWSWVKEYQLYQVMNEAVAINENRFRWVRSAYQLGDRAAIDTTEVLAQWQQFELLRSQAWLNFQNAGLELSVYLWTAGAQPYELPSNIIPQEPLRDISVMNQPVPVLNELLNAAVSNHPELRLYQYKLQALNIERKLKFQELLPVVNFRYNQLGRGYDVWKTATSPYFENNYRYGLSISIPLRLSQGRGEYKKARLKINYAELELEQKKRQVENKVRSYFNELLALKEQVKWQEQSWRNYLQLQRAEELRFRSGESSLFLVNARETKALEALQKLLELKAKYFVSENTVRWAAGNLVQE